MAKRGGLICRSRLPGCHGRARGQGFITTSSFTRDARAEATRDGAPAIDLIDGEDLCSSPQREQYR
ncbi:restriction endonuclease [Rhizobium laguerreae]